VKILRQAMHVFINSYKRFVLRSILLGLFICNTVRLQAQLCNGSLGDPVVNITFGDGSGNNTGYTPTNAYTYTGSSCPNDGFYTITRSSFACFGNTWHTVTTDHTGGGAFLLVNASLAPGDFFVATVTDLCPNTTYEFASWILNILNRAGIKPNITFTIETPTGTILQQFVTGDIPETPSPEWKQYGFFFTTPVNNPVIVLRMRNNAPGGIGNDLALDDITFRPCGAVTVTSSIQGNSNDTVNTCEGNTSSYSLDATISTGYTSPVYFWQVSTDSGSAWKDIAGANTLHYLRMPSKAGAYWYRVTVTEKSTAATTACRIASNYIVINVHAQPFVNAGGNRTMLAGTTITLNGAVIGENPSYFWDPPDGLSDIKITTPAANPVADKRYTLYAVSAFGCSNDDTAHIKVVAGIFVPTAFTPNKDGKNDSWRIPFLDPSLDAEVNIYNRFGQMIYHVKGAVVDWDGNFKGTAQPPGTYVYSIRFNNGYPEMKGSILLIR
jgi:gliding motility-associated-like protein